MKVLIDKSDRLQKAPQALLGVMRLTEKSFKARGLEHIDLDSIVPELPDHLPFIEAIRQENLAPATPAGETDTVALKEAIAEIYSGIYGRPIHPVKEIALTPGSRSTIVLLCLGMLNPDNVVALPDPGLAMYRLGAIMAGATPLAYPLLEKNDYLPNINSLLERPPRNLRLIIMNYPHIPTGAEADLFFYRDLLGRLRRHNILVALDCPFIGQIEPPIELPLQLRKAAKHVIELHSFGIPYGLNGLGFAIGHPGAIAVLNQVADICGFHPFQSQIKYALLGLKYHSELAALFAQKISERRRILGDGLRELGWKIRAARQGPFIWAKIPSRATSVGFARKMFIRTGVRARAGSDFGEHGEGYLRLSLTADIGILEKALENIRKDAGMHQKRRD
jgi:LL-diaminopimelate aminotransferase